MKDFNFFSFYEEGGKSKRIPLLYGGLTVVVASFVVISVFGLNYIKINNINKEIASMEQVINSSENRIKLKDIEEEDKKISIMKEYYTKVEPIDGKITTQDVLSSNLISKVSSCIPKDVYFKSISMDSNGIQIQGDGISRIAIAEFEHKLKALDVVENVHIASISKASEEKQTYTFSLKCMLKDVVNNEGN